MVGGGGGGDTLTERRPWSRVLSLSIPGSNLVNLH